ncbi:MAG: VOC family protein [Actinobacteria bacterium]|nr:VOC family protein [Actinomycetota bacterium]
MSTHLVPYLIFDGQCREAMEFYQSLLGGELTLSPFSDAPGETAPENADRVIHALLRSDDVILMASDSMPGMTTTFGDSNHLSLVGDDEPRLTEIFNTLADGGSVQMPLEKQFWGDIFGMCTDRFGHRWMVNIGELQ